MAGNLVLGMDGGGTKTLTVVADVAGREQGRATAGPGNYQAVGREAAFAALNQSIDDALAAAGAALQNLSGVCLGLAGVDRPADLELLSDWARQKFGETPVRIINDARLVLAAGTPEDWGVAVISGTGSIVYGMDGNGNLTRAGGWGYLLGDEGSGYDIGRQALRAVVMASDGRGPLTRLTEMVLDEYHLSQPSDLVGWIYDPNRQRADIASVTGLVDRAVSEGDPVAAMILQEAARQLALTVQAVTSRLGLNNPVPCALAGGVVTHSRHFRARFQEACLACNVRLNPVMVVEEPVQGALRLARQLAAKGSL